MNKYREALDRIKDIFVYVEDDYIDETDEGEMFYNEFYRCEGTVAEVYKKDIALLEEALSLLEKNSLRPVIMNEEIEKYKGLDKISKPEDWFYNNGNFSCNLSDLVEKHKDDILKAQAKIYEEKFNQLKGE